MRGATVPDLDSGPTGSTVHRINSEQKVSMELAAVAVVAAVVVGGEVGEGVVRPGWLWCEVERRRGKTG